MGADDEVHELQTLERKKNRRRARFTLCHSILPVLLRTRNLYSMLSRSRYHMAQAPVRDADSYELVRRGTKSQFPEVWAPAATHHSKLPRGLESCMVRTAWLGQALSLLCLGFCEWSHC